MEKRPREELSGQGQPAAMAAGTSAPAGLRAAGGSSAAADLAASFSQSALVGTFCLSYRRPATALRPITQPLTPASAGTGRTAC